MHSGYPFDADEPVYTASMAVPGNLCFRCAKRLATVRSSNPGDRDLCEVCASQRAGVDAKELDLAVAAPPMITRAPCPFCNTKLEIGERICHACGRDPSTFNAEDGSEPFEGRRCEHCEYDLRGISGDICPECGESVSPSLRSQFETTAAETLRREIRKPLIIGAIALVLWMGLFAFRFGAIPALMQLALYPVLITSTTIAFLIFGALSGGIDPPLWLISLRMCAIVPAVKFVETIFTASKLSWSLPGGIIAGGLVFSFLVVDLFDLDFADVRMLIALNVVAWFTTQFIIQALM